LLAGVCRLSSSVTLPVSGPAAGLMGGRVADTARHGTVGQYGYIPLGRHLILSLFNIVLSQEIGWEEHLRNYLFCVEWDVKP